MSSCQKDELEVAEASEIAIKEKSQSSSSDIMEISRPASDRPIVGNGAPLTTDRPTVGVEMFPTTDRPIVGEKPKPASPPGPPSDRPMVGAPGPPTDRPTMGNKPPQQTLKPRPVTDRPIMGNKPPPQTLKPRPVTDRPIVGNVIAPPVTDLPMVAVEMPTPASPPMPSTDRPMVSAPRPPTDRPIVGENPPPLPPKPRPVTDRPTLGSGNPNGRRKRSLAPYPEHGSYVDETYDAKRTLHLYMYYVNRSYDEKEQYVIYDINSLIADVGGFMGLLLGFSIQSMVEMIEVRWKSLTGRQKNGKRGEKKERPVVVKRRA